MTYDVTDASNPCHTADACMLSAECGQYWQCGQVHGRPAQGGRVHKVSTTESGRQCCEWCGMEVERLPWREPGDPPAAPWPNGILVCFNAAGDMYAWDPAAPWPNGILVCFNAAGDMYAWDGVGGSLPNPCLERTPNDGGATP